MTVRTALELSPLFQPLSCKSHQLPLSVAAFDSHVRSLPFAGALSTDALDLLMILGRGLLH